VGNIVIKEISPVNYVGTPPELPPRNKKSKGIAEGNITDNASAETESTKELSTSESKIAISAEINNSIRKLREDVGYSTNEEDQQSEITDIEDVNRFRRVPNPEVSNLLDRRDSAEEKSYSLVSLLSASQIKIETLQGATEEAESIRNYETLLTK